MSVNKMVIHGACSPVNRAIASSPKGRYLARRNVRFGSLADIKAPINHVRFSLKKRHDYLSISLNFKLASKGPPIRALKKFSRFKNNEMDVTDSSHRRGLRWLDFEVSKAETELALARHKLEND